MKERHFKLKKELKDLQKMLKMNFKILIWFHKGSNRGPRGYEPACYQKAIQIYSYEVCVTMEVKQETFFHKIFTHATSQ